jgi:hypothetical protein
MANSAETMGWAHRGDGYAISSVNEEDQITNIPDDDVFNADDAGFFTNSFGDCSVTTIDGIQYIRIQADNFTIISRYYKNCSDYNRQLSGVGASKMAKLAQASYRNPVMSELHSYSTRKLERYTGNISVILKHTFTNEINKVLSTIMVLFPDILRYYMRSSTRQIKIDTLMDVEDFNLKLNGSAIDVMRLFMSDQFYHLTSDLWTHYMSESDDISDLKDVKVNMPADKFTEIVGFGRPGKDDIGTNCSICFENIKKTERVSKTTCGHKFHTRCLRRWLTKECSTPTCPMCRADLYPERNQD